MRTKQERDSRAAIVDQAPGETFHPMEGDLRLERVLVVG